MIETGETIEFVENKTVFCERPWKLPAMILAFLVVVTFGWGIYILNSYDEDDFFGSNSDLSVSQFLLRDVAAQDVQHLYATVPPAVVGVGASGVNASPVAAGAIIGANGYVITTLHAVSDLPGIDVQVYTPTGVHRYPAQVVKTVPTHDLVLLKMKTSERFMYFRMSASPAVMAGESVFAFGRNMNGNAVVRQGNIQSANMSLDVGGVQVTHLLRSDAVYSWEQNGGPLVNGQGELVGINITLQGQGGRVEGYTVPASVIISHFQDVLRFKTGAAAATGMPGTLAVAQPAAAGASAWWAQARTVAGTANNTAVGVNLAPGAANGRVWHDADHAGGFTLAGYSMSDILGLLALSLAAGVTGGMMTMGGGVLQVAGMMVFFGYGMYLIRPVAFLTNVAVYGASALRNNKSGLIQWDVVKPLVPWGVAGVVLGYFIGNAIGDGVVGTLLGLFALAMAFKAVTEMVNPNDLDRVKPEAANLDELSDALSDDHKPEQAAPKADSWLSRLNITEGTLRHAVLGMPMGLISGILGISGGVIEVPLQRYIGKIGLQNAIANSSVLVFWASVAGTLVAFIHGLSSGLIHWEAPIMLALVMIPGAYVGGLLGAKLLRTLPVQTLKGIYALTMLAIAVKMLMK